MTSSELRLARMIDRLRNEHRHVSGGRFSASHARRVRAFTEWMDRGGSALDGQSSLKLREAVLELDCTFQHVEASLAHWAEVETPLMWYRLQALLTGREEGFVLQDRGFAFRQLREQLRDGAFDHLRLGLESCHVRVLGGSDPIVTEGVVRQWVDEWRAVAALPNFGEWPQAPRRGLEVLIKDLEMLLEALEYGASAPRLHAGGDLSQLIRHVSESKPPRASVAVTAAFGDLRGWFSGVAECSKECEDRYFGGGRLRDFSFQLDELVQSMRAGSEVSLRQEVGDHLRWRKWATLGETARLEGLLAGVVAGGRRESGARGARLMVASFIDIAEIAGLCVLRRSRQELGESLRGLASWVHSEGVSATDVLKEKLEASERSSEFERVEEVRKRVLDLWSQSGNWRLLRDSVGQAGETLSAIEAVCSAAEGCGAEELLKPLQEAAVALRRFSTDQAIVGSVLGACSDWSDGWDLLASVERCGVLVRRTIGCPPIEQLQFFTAAREFVRRGLQAAGLEWATLGLMSRDVEGGSSSFASLERSLGQRRVGLERELLELMNREGEGAVNLVATCGVDLLRNRLTARVVELEGNAWELYEGGKQECEAWIFSRDSEGFDDDCVVGGKDAIEALCRALGEELEEIDEVHEALPELAAAVQTVREVGGEHAAVLTKVMESLAVAEGLLEKAWKVREEGAVLSVGQRFGRESALQELEELLAVDEAVLGRELRSAVGAVQQRIRSIDLRDWDRMLGEERSSRGEAWSAAAGASTILPAQFGQHCEAVREAVTRAASGEEAVERLVQVGEQLSSSTGVGGEALGCELLSRLVESNPELGQLLGRTLLRAIDGALPSAWGTERPKQQVLEMLTGGEDGIRRDSQGEESSLERTILWAIAVLICDSEVDLAANGSLESGHAELLRGLREGALGAEGLRSAKGAVLQRVSMAGSSFAQALHRLGGSGDSSRRQGIRRNEVVDIVNDR